MMTLTLFRQLLPVFADTTAYPDTMVQYQIDLAINSLNPIVWGVRLDNGVLYYAAHYVALAGPQPTVGGSSPNPPPATIPGLATGLVTSKSVGSVSKGYDVSVGQTEGGGSFNLTYYGQQYLTMLKSVGVGAFQL